MYEFGPFRADTLRGVLTRDGEPVPLTGKCFEVLVHLVRQGPATVSKDDLMRAVWADTFVEESNLTQHVSLLRKALGESPQDRLYIVTVPGQGYRFVAQVCEIQPSIEPNLEGLAVGSQPDGPVAGVEAYKAADHDAQPSPTEPLLSEPLPALRAQPHRRRWLAFSISASAAAVLLAAATLVWFSRGSASRPLGAKDSVLLSDFENRTGEAVFDGALQEGLAVELGQSPFLGLAAQDSVRETLRFMGRSPDEPVRLPWAREVCERLGAKALISGSIARLGSSYVIAVEAEDCADASVLAREQVEAKTREEVLPVLGKLASRLRRRLGESLGSVQQFDSPLVEATTPSLEALRAYSLGMAARTRGPERDAIPFFEHAIELDPRFAMAYAQLGTAYGNLGETERAADYTTRAYGLRANLSEQEKLYLAAKYYTIVTGDTTRAAETYEVWSRMYPRDWRPFNGLAARYQVVGKYEEARAAAQSALDLQPHNYSPYANLAGSLLALNKTDEAEQVCHRAAAAGRDSVYTHRVLFDIAFLRRDEAAHQRELAWARTTGHENDLLTAQAFALAASGQLKAARRLFDQANAALQSDGFLDHAAYTMANEALAEADFGNFSEARSQASAALQLGHGIDPEEMTAEALGLSGDEVHARAMARDLHQRFPNHAPLNMASLPAALAAIELRDGHPAKALQMLEVAAPYDLCEFSDLSPVYLRGQAYLGVKDGPGAAAEFHKILDHPGIDATSQRQALAHLGLARAYALSGDMKKSRSAYEEFFALWAHADPDLPVLRAARREYESLGRPTIAAK